MATVPSPTVCRTDALWRALVSLRVEPEGAEITFTAKLAHEQGWRRARAEAVFEEYRRFLYLAATAREPVSPSEAIDRCWHLHLTYSRHYWDVLCGTILQRPLHHDPSLGGPAEDARHAEQYRRTLDAYRAAFGEEPPAAIWDAPQPARVGRGAALSAAAGASLLVAACTALAAADSADDDIGSWFPFIFIAVVFVIVVIGIRSAARGRGGRRTGSDGGCGSGCGSDSDSGSDGGSSCGSSCGGGGD
jgi:hypothetical protein